MAVITPHQSLQDRTKVMQNVIPIKQKIKHAAGKLFLNDIQRIMHLC